MKLTFLGTSAGEFYPAMWCRCPHCAYARTHQGRNLRRHSCALLDDDVMLDFSSHAFITAAEMDLDITGVRTLLVTHDHADHFDPLNLVCRIAPSDQGEWLNVTEACGIDAMDRFVGPRFTPLPMLDVYGHESVYAAMRRGNIHIGGYDGDHAGPNDEELFSMRFHALTRGQRIEKPQEDLAVTALVSHHAVPGHVFNYVIQRGGKTLLYACDCGGYDDDMLDLLKTFRFDCVVFEGTFGLMAKEDKNHMNLQKNLQMLRFMNDHHLWAGAPRFILTHIAPHKAPPYDLYRPMVEERGMILAYDGMTVDI